MPDSAFLIACSLIFNISDISRCRKCYFAENLSDLFALDAGKIGRSAAGLTKMLVVNKVIPLLP